MIIKNALKEAVIKLNTLENPHLEAEVLLSALLKKNRTWLKTHPEFELTPPQAQTYHQWVEQRAQNVPTAYITGMVEWNGLRLKVTPDTLIPRDETETLCHHVKSDQKEDPVKILDIGTGSGCIAVWMKTQFPKAQVTAVDISEAALKVAQKNAETLNLDVRFQRSDLLSGLSPHQDFEIIIANLPYVPKSTAVTAEVSQEPQTAIFSGADGLGHIRRLAEALEKKAITYEQLWLEFLPAQAETIKTLFATKKVTLFNDVSQQPFFAQIKPRA